MIIRLNFSLLYFFICVIFVIFHFLNFVIFFLSATKIKTFEDTFSYFCGSNLKGMYNVHCMYIFCGTYLFTRILQNFNISPLLFSERFLRHAPCGFLCRPLADFQWPRWVIWQYKWPFLWHRQRVSQIGRFAISE